MRNAVLSGKPDVGNPHVRIDEGEVAPCTAKQRRGSLLYRLSAVGYALAGVLSVLPCAVSATPYEVTVETGIQENFTSEQLSAIASGDYDEIVKKGAGTLKVTSSLTISDFAGKITIAEGIYEVDVSSGALGVSDTSRREASGTCVLSGAALHFNCPGPKSAHGYERESFFIAGDGVTGASVPGAVVRLGVVTYLGRITLTADASLGGETDLMLHVAERINLSTHKLTVRQGLSFGDVYIENPGRIDFLSGEVYMPVNSKYYAGAEFEFHFGSGARIMCILPQTESLGRKLVMDGNVTVYAKKGKGCSALSWYDDIEIAEGATLTFDIENLERADLFSPISGKGSLRKAANTNFASALWLHGTNTYEGTTSIVTGGVTDVIVAKNRLSLPGLADGRADGAFAEAGTGLGFGIRTEEYAEGWNGEDVTNALARAAGKKSRFYLAVEKGETGIFTNDVNLAECCSHLGTIGGGTVTTVGRFVQASGNTFSFVPFSADDGLALSCADGDERGWTFGEIRVRQGALHFKDAGTVRFSSGWSPLWVGWTQSDAQVTFEGATDYYNAYRLTIPEQKQANGLAVIKEGAKVTSICLFGNYNDSVGCLYQQGGQFTASAGSVIGNTTRSAGYLEVSGGETIFPQNVSLAQHGGATVGEADLSVGMLYQKGGTITHSDKNGKALSVGAGGHGVYYLKEGAYSGHNAIYVPRARTSTDYTAGSGNLTVAGKNARLQVDLSGIYLCDRDDSVGFLNLLDGGVASLRVVVKATKTSEGSVALGSNRKAYMGFNGGVLQAQSSRDILMSSGAPDFVTVYDGGAIIDTAGFEVGVTTSLKRPNGDGIVSIALPEGSLTGYLAPPLVVITGDGEGASAVAEFDSSSGTVTGVTVTSPGWGYQAETTVVTLKGPAKTASVTCVATIAADGGTGGLTKRGAGTLTLAQNNTYSGPTVIEEGRLKITTAGAIPEGGEVVVKGGTLEIAAGRMPMSWRVDMDFSKLDRTQKLTLVEVTSTASGAVPTLPVGGVPDDWAVRIAGNKVTLGYRSGLAVIVR